MTTRVHGLRSWLAAIAAPLVIVAWFLWPVMPFNHSPGDIIRSVATAYALFFLARGLAFLAASALSTSRAAYHAFVFIFAFLISFSVSVGLTLAGVAESPLVSAATGALQDAFWCAVAGLIYVYIGAGIK